MRTGLYMPIYRSYTYIYIYTCIDLIDDNSEVKCTVRGAVKGGRTDRYIPPL